MQGLDPKPGDLSMARLKREGKTSWRTEPTEVENVLDELWIGVKGQSNLEIAGSPRNIFRYSLSTVFNGGRALNGLGAPPGYQTQSNSEYRLVISGSQTAGDKFLVERERTQTAS